ncbi:porin family protein [bacterium]|nr:porin family protein [bacterium]MBU1637750.1 porin family protein [bacterium]MBU1919299.1 porin family protein [bacterium]
MNRMLIWVLGLLVFTVHVNAMDYLDLKDGRRIAGAILRQDTTAVYMTDWKYRSERFPPLQVFSRDEIRAIWFDTPTDSRKSGSYYKPRSGLFELGGGSTFQTWQASDYDRRYLFQVSCFGAMSISPILGLEADIDFTVPSGGGSDQTWRKLDFSHHVSMNIIANLPWNKRIIPYVLAGGGSSEGIPTGGVLLTESSDAHNLVQAGIGLKYGVDGLGFRLELRHSYYIWKEDQLVLDPDNYEETYIRRLRMDADATVLRISVFSYF